MTAPAIDRCVALRIICDGSSEESHPPVTVAVFEMEDGDTEPSLDAGVSAGADWVTSDARRSRGAALVLRLRCMVPDCPMEQLITEQTLGRLMLVSFAMSQGVRPFSYPFELRKVGALN